jgi:hypothetical protein
MSTRKHLEKEAKTDSPWPVDLLCRHEKVVPDWMKRKCDYYLDSMKMIYMRSSKAATMEEANDVVRLLDILACNSFAIVNGIDISNPVGKGLYILPSFLNHSCEPNCAYVHDGLKMSIRSIRDIEPGTQLYITYTELTDPLEKRRESLKDGYHFTCKCQRCTSVGLDPLLMSVLCTKCRKVLLPGKRKVPPSLDISFCHCGKPGKVPTPNIARISEEFEFLSEQFLPRDRDMLERLMSLETRAEKIISPYHHLSIHIKERIMGLALDNLELEIAIKVGRSLAQLYQLYLEVSPVHTVHLIKLLTAWESVEGSGEETAELRSSVMKNLLITHGPSHPLYASTQRSMALDSSQ